MEQVDVVYTLANLSKFKDDFELRYSLRSMHAQPWVRNIVLVGHRPRWAKNVVHIPCDDPHKAKDANIIGKVLAACKDESVSDNFVVNSDDHYILRPIGLQDLGPWVDTTLTQEIAVKKQCRSVWHKRLARTVHWCQQNDHCDSIFQCHTPYLVNGGKYIEAMAKCPWSRDGGLLTHIYFNLIGNSFPNEPVKQTFRVKQKICEEFFRQSVAESTFLNHNNAGLSHVVREEIEKIFSIPSKWE